MRTAVPKAAARRSLTRTLTPDLLQQDAADLVSRLIARGMLPTHMVAIASAGSYVAEAMAEHFESRVAILELTCRRPSTGLKERFAPVLRLTRHLPRQVLDYLRDREMRLVTGSLDTNRNIEMSEEHEAALRIAATSPQSRFLVVDDCVDSGATLLAAIAHIRDLVGDGDRVHSVAIALSLEDPLIRPDVWLYENTGLRGPWSYDY